VYDIHAQVYCMEDQWQKHIEIIYEFKMLDMF
jgi:hypothetical protein